MNLPTDQNIKDFFKSIWARTQADFKYLWDNDRIFLVIFGVLVVIAKGSSLIISFLAAKSKAEVAVATAESNVLQAQENAANQQAIQAASQGTFQTPPKTVSLRLVDGAATTTAPATSTGMSTGTKVVLVLGGAAVVGGGLWLLLK